MLLQIAIGWKCPLFCNRIPLSIDAFHKIKNALNKCPTMYHFVAEICTHVNNSIQKLCIVGYGSYSLCYMCIRSTTQTHIYTRNYLVDHRSSLDDFGGVYKSRFLNSSNFSVVQNHSMPFPSNISHSYLAGDTCLWWNVMQQITRHIHINRNVPVGTINELSFGNHRPCLQTSVNEWTIFTAGPSNELVLSRGT